MDNERHAPVTHYYGKPKWINRGDLVIDCTSQRVLLAGVDLHVTSSQFRILRPLCDADGAVVTYEELSRALYGERGGNDHERIFKHVQRIRRLIEKDPSRPKILITIRGQGFRLTT